MVKKSIKIELSSGLEARPAAMLVQVASQYDSKIYLEADSKRVNAKSIMGMILLSRNNVLFLSVMKKTRQPSALPGFQLSF